MLIDLLQSSYFSVFLIVALGFMLGRIKIAGLSLDVSAVIFIALAFGHWGVSIPKELGNFGLVLFIFTIGIQAVARLIGNDVKKLSDTDFFPIAMGIVLGVLFGKLNISFGGGVSFSPGLTGGILMMALFLSAIGKTGPIIWSMSGPANQLLRQLGLLLFLAEVGTSAGKTLVSTFQESGFLLFGVGAAITLVPMLLAALVGRLVFKISMLDLLGTITGGMTSTPGLAAADSMTDSNIPGVAYATVYPIAMVFLILFIQVIALAVL